MKISLSNPIEKHKREVQVDVGDRVSITIWDEFSVEGIVGSVSSDKLSIHSARFLEGCYPEGDYSSVQEKSEFTFRVNDIASLEVAGFDQTTPLTLIHSALQENYCGSKEIVMSPLFYKWYREYVKQDHTMYHSYLSYPIREDQNLHGMSVYAVPTEQSLKHRLTPKRCYIIKFYQDKTLKVTSIFSAFDDELATEIKMRKERWGFSSYLLYSDHVLIERGTGKGRYPTC